MSLLINANLSNQQLALSCRCSAALHAATSQRATCPLARRRTRCRGQSACAMRYGLLPTLMWQSAQRHSSWGMATTRTWLPLSVCRWAGGAAACSCSQCMCNGSLEYFVEAAALGAGGAGTSKIEWRLCTFQCSPKWTLAYPPACPPPPRLCSCWRRWCVSCCPARRCKASCTSGWRRWLLRPTWGLGMRTRMGRCLTTRLSRHSGASRRRRPLQPRPRQLSQGRRVARPAAAS